MENLDLVYQASSNSKSLTHSRPAECGSRQAIQTGPDHSNGVVPPTRGFPSNMQQVAPASNRPICHEVQQQVTSVCLCHRYRIPWPQQWMHCLSWEDLDAYAFPPAAILGKVVEKLQDSPCKRIIVIAPGWPNMPWFWDLVTMPSQIPLSLPNLPNLVNTALQSDPSQKSDKSKSPCVAPRASAIKEQGFSEAVAARIEAPQGDQPDQSMRQSGPFLQNGASVIRWTSGHPL